MATRTASITALALAFHAVAGVSFGTPFAHGGNDEYSDVGVDETIEFVTGGSNIPTMTVDQDGGIAIKSITVANSVDAHHRFRLHHQQDHAQGRRRQHHD